MISTRTIESIRADFPLLQRTQGKNPYIYFDNAATTQKPRSVLDAARVYYETLNSNVHRGVHTLSQQATDAFEESRRVIQRFIHAREDRELIFTKGTTHGINIVAHGFSRAVLKPGDEVLISGMEHHSNIVPWQMACEYTGAVLKVIPLNDRGEIIYEEFLKLLTPRVKILAVVQVSNALGTVNPVKEMIADAHRLGIPVLVDGAQSTQHLRVDVQDLDADFFVFSAHKVFAATGFGVLYGKAEWLDKLPPYEGGGEMIREVTFEKTTYNELPFKFEAGTPHIEGALSLAEAIRYIEGLGIDFIAAREAELLSYATESLAQIPEVIPVGTAAHKASVLSFNIRNAHHLDVGTLLDKQGIAVRTGHHCAQPLMQRFGIAGTVRASFAFYNTTAEIDAFHQALVRSIGMLV